MNILSLLLLLLLLLLLKLIIVKSNTIITNDIVINSYKGLIKYYSYETGLFNDTHHYWTSANSIETLCNYYNILLKTNENEDIKNEINNIINNSYQKLRLFFHNYQRYYYWFVLAFIRAYEVTNDINYLELSNDVFKRMIDWGTWNETCPGIMWSAESKYRNSITNELFLNAATKLYKIYNNDYYKNWVDTELNWFLSTKLITDLGIVIDGLPTNNCSVNAIPVGDYWTYNSGVLLDALCRNNKIDLAINITMSTLKYYSKDNIMLELSCNSNGYCSGLDGKMFKGAFIRHLFYSLDYYPNDVKENIKKWIILQAESIITNASVQLDDGTLLLNQQWQGPIPKIDDDDQMVSQSSAFDAILSAYQLI